MEKLYKVNGYLLEEGPMIAVAAYIRETQGFEALVKFSDEIGIPAKELFLLLLPYKHGKRVMRHDIHLYFTFIKLLVWEGHSYEHIAIMLGYKETKQTIKVRSSRMLKRVGYEHAFARMKLQESNPRIKKLLDIIKETHSNNVQGEEKEECDIKMFSAVEELLRTSSYSLKAVVHFLGCDYINFRNQLVRFRKRVAESQ